MFLTCHEKHAPTGYAEGLLVQTFFFFVSFHFANRGGLRLALFVARLLVVLMFPRFFQNTGLLKLLFKALQCAVKRLIGPNLDLGQLSPPPAVS